MKDTFVLKGVNITIKLLLGFLFIINVAAGLYMPLLAVYATEYIVGASLALVGSAGAMYSVMKSVIQIPMAKWLDRQAGEKSDFYLLFFAGLSGVIYTFYLLFVNTIIEFYIFQILSGLVDGFMMAAFYAIFSHHIDKESQGFEWSLFSVGGLTMALAVGGFFGGFMADTHGFKSIFLLAGILNIIGALIILFLYPYLKIMRKRENYKTIKVREDID